eukprot:GHVR01046659.1.p1 GENE.GHVR01046659.1~~GHVR01046659.1.p1  ORF type:complete len:166 (-),score=19.55 GHVR01046659.1:1310-1807(-)
MPVQNRGNQREPTQQSRYQTLEAAGRSLVAARSAMEGTSKAAVKGSQDSQTQENLSVCPMSSSLDEPIGPEGEADRAAQYAFNIERHSGGGDALAIFIDGLQQRIAKENGKGVCFDEMFSLFRREDIHTEGIVRAQAFRRALQEARLVRTEAEANSQSRVLLFYI